jgi:hypothetical protein
MTHAKLQQRTAHLHAALLRAGFKQDVWGHYVKEGAVKTRIVVRSSGVRVETRELGPGSAWRTVVGAYIFQIQYPTESSVKIGRYVFAL